MKCCRVRCFTWALSMFTSAASLPLLSQTPDLRRAPAPPELFGEGVFSTGAWDFFVALAQDQRTAYFCRANGSFTYFTILLSDNRGGRWSPPRVAPFSGRWSDADPHISPDGSKLFYISNRPINPTDSIARDDYDIWMVEKNAAGNWGVPKHLPSPINMDGTTEWSPSPAANGNLYFGSARPGGKGNNDIYVARWQNGAYVTPENVGDSVNTRAGEVEPWIAPDESYMIISGQGISGGLGGFDLFISYNRNGIWQKPLHLENGINSGSGDFNQSVSPDGQWLYFSSSRGIFDKMPARRLTYQEMQQRLTSPRNGLGDIYRVRMTDLGVPSPATTRSP